MCSSSTSETKLLQINLDKKFNTRVNADLKVVFAPKFVPIDDYQKQLIQALEQLGVQINGIDCHKRFLPSEIRKERPDIVHLHWLHTFFGAPRRLMNSPIYRYFGLAIAIFRSIQFLMGLAILKLMGIKIVWTAHNLRPHESFYPLLDQICTSFVAHFSDIIFAHCQEAKSILISEFRLKNTNKISVVPHGNYVKFYKNEISQQDARKSLNIPDSDLVFLFLGLIRPYKGIFELIEAFQHIEHDHIQLIIAGKPLNDELSERINQAISKLDNIRYFPGFVPNDQIQVYMNACDVGTLPYQNILTSGAAILMMSFGKACIAPSLGCIGEVLDSSGSFLYQLRDHKGLIQALQEAINNKGNLPSMGKYNRQRVEEWSWEYVAEKTLSIYQKCLR